jgi:hypothetical protein
MGVSGQDNIRARETVRFMQRVLYGIIVAGSFYVNNAYCICIYYTKKFLGGEDGKTVKI